MQVSRKLRRLDPKKYKVLNDVLIVSHSRSSQIDHLIISTFGIFVIETKSLSGWIFGNEHRDKWTQTLYNRKYQFRNPIIQSWGHIRTLKEVLTDLHYTHYMPIVVFTGNSTLKNVKSSIPVIKKRKLLRTIKSNSTAEYLPKDAVDSIYQKLIRLNKTDKQSRKAHIKRVKQNQTKNWTSNTCPKCGSKLSIRKGKHGSFYGCSSYPACSFTKSIWILISLLFN